MFFFSAGEPILVIYGSKLRKILNNFKRWGNIRRKTIESYRRNECVLIIPIEMFAGSIRTALDADINL